MKLTFLGIFIEFTQAIAFFSFIFQENETIFPKNLESVISTTQRNIFSVSFQIEWNMIVLKTLLLFLIQNKFHLVHI